MLLGDDRSNVDANLIPDARATHFWDPDRLLGTWFPKQEEYKSLTFGPIAWDIYFLYGADAKWEDTPEPLVTSGRTVISKSANLEKSLNQLLAAN